MAFYYLRGEEASMIRVILFAAIIGVLTQNAWLALLAAAVLGNAILANK